MIRLLRNPTSDKTLIRLTFDYKHGQELTDYHQAINGELVSGYSELSDNGELFAEETEAFKFILEVALRVS